MNFDEAEFAWPGGDKPGELRFLEKVPSEIRELILRKVSGMVPSFDAQEARTGALRPVKELAGRYFVSGGHQSYFVRISSRIGNPELEQALTRFLAERIRGVNRILFTEIFSRQGKKYRLDVRPFLHGRHFNGSKEDLLRVARSLGYLHRFLKDYPLQGEVRRLAARRYEHLAEITGQVRSHLDGDALHCPDEVAAWIRERRGWLGNMLELFDPGFHLMANAQCLHGEVHPGNVIFSNHREEAVLVDFEESVHTFAPPSWDLTFLVQRFCMSDDPAPEILRKRLRVVEEGYGMSLPGLTTMVRQCAWYSVMVLLDQLHRQINSPLSEYEKFFRLEQQAAALDALL